MNPIDTNTIVYHLAIQKCKDELIDRLQKRFPFRLIEEDSVKLLNVVANKEEKGSFSVCFSQGGETYTLSLDQDRLREKGYERKELSSAVSRLSELLGKKLDVEKLEVLKAGFFSVFLFEKAPFPPLPNLNQEHFVETVFAFHLLYEGVRYRVAKLEGGHYLASIFPKGAHQFQGSKQGTFYILIDEVDQEEP